MLEKRIFSDYLLKIQKGNDSHVMNRFENKFSTKGEAKLTYGDGDYQVVSPGEFVTCAVSGQQIPLDELRYWSVELQEAYASSEISLQRFRETRH